jgi:hypothetical protein
MNITPTETVSLVAVVQAPWVGLWLRERLKRSAVEKVARDRATEMSHLGARVLDLQCRQLRLLAQISALWALLAKLGHTALDLRERYTQEAMELARERKWSKHHLWESAELGALVTRILARWAAERRIRASESLATEVLSAIAHYSGLGRRTG